LEFVKLLVRELRAVVLAPDVNQLASSPRSFGRLDEIMPFDFSDAELETAARACRAFTLVLGLHTNLLG